jgi:hypothetical protein
MRALAAAVLVSLVIAACGGAGAPSSAVRSTPPPPVATASAPVAPVGPVATADPSKPAFLTTSLTDVRTGAPFTIGGFPGRVVLVIAMAVW